MTDDTGSHFNIFVEDDRYAVPTLRFFVEAEGLPPDELAARVLAENEHHIGVEVRQGDRRVVALGACAERVTEPKSWGAPKS